MDDKGDKVDHKGADYSGCISPDQDFHPGVER